MSETQATFDFAIVGQGLAGTLVTHQLQKLGRNVIVIDNNYPRASSKVAAGIINPITGRNFVLSWRFMDFYQVALNVYDELSELLGSSVFLYQDILRTLDTISEENTWASKSSDPKLAQFIQYPLNENSWSPYINHNLPLGHIIGSGRLNMPLLTSLYRHKLKKEGRLLDDTFDLDLMESDDEGLTYKGLKFRELILCQGAQMTNDHPYFGDLKLSQTKGQVLIIRCPGLNVQAMYKKKIFFAPIGNDLYWVGGGYEWDAQDDLPTDLAKSEILDLIKEMADIPPFEIVEHMAAFRPTVQTRRPVMATSAKDNRVHVFNGLGTKGASMGPFLSIQFVNYLMSKDESLLTL